MNYIVFNIFLFLMLVFFIDSKEMKVYINKKEGQYLLLANILISNILYFLGTQEVFILLIALVGIAAYVDYRYMEIPNMATILGLAVTFLYFCINIKNVTFFDIGLSVSIYGVFFIACLLGGFGGGDLKILLPIILMLGGNRFLIFISLCSVIAFIMLILKKKKIQLKTSLPLAPAFYGAFLIMTII